MFEFQVDLTCGHDESWSRVLGQDRHPPQLDIKQLAPALGQVQGATFAELKREDRQSASHDLILQHFPLVLTPK